MSGPSFLGLGDEPARDLDYLLEDEEPSSGHKSMSIVLLLLLAGVVYAGWRWRAEIYPRAAEALHRVQAIIAPSSSTNSSSQTPTEPPPASATDSHTITPQDERSTTAPEKTDPAKQPPAPETSTPASSAPASAATTSNATASQSKAAESAESQSGEGSNAEESSAKPDQAAAETDTVPVKNTKPRAAVPKSPKKEIQPATSSDTSDERLIADGEKYLYGTGVPENCDRAQKYLQTAAQHSNSKAQAMLGTMYFTGHCATRDLPTAYRWFARALHGDPGNSRIQQDLEILWKAMTPDERQLAMRRE